MSRKSPSRLVRQLTESQVTEAKPVVIAYRQIPYWKCPGCEQEIHEKHSYPEDTLGESRVMIHSDCGTRFTPPPPTPEEQEWLRKWTEGLARAIGQ